MNTESFLKRVQTRFKVLWKRMPIIASNIAKSEFEENFRRQGYRNDNGVVIPWEGTKKKKNTFGKKSSGVLIGKGKLRRRFFTRPQGDVAAVVNDTPYAEAYNEGFKGTVNVKEHKRTKFKKTKVGTGLFNRKTKNERQRTEKTKSGEGMVKAHTMKMDVKRRPFMITTNPLIADIEKAAFKEIDTIWK